MVRFEKDADDDRAPLAPQIFDLPLMSCRGSSDTGLAQAISKAAEQWRDVPAELYRIDKQVCIQSAPLVFA